MKKTTLLIIIALFIGISAVSQNNNVLAATPTPTEYPPFPTATAYAPPSSKADIFRDDESGFSIKIPKGVKATTSSPDSGRFQEYELGNTEVFGYLYPSRMEAGQSQEEVGKNARDIQTAGLENLKYQKDETITLSGGVKAWYSQFRGYLSQNDYTIEVRLYTVINSNRAVTLMFYSLPQNFPAWNKTINELLDSITLTAPVVMGFPRHEVLILEGGESDNPRENDPATTHSAGDNLVFSGLVTFSDKLEIMPELAARWEISAGGTIFTFHLQPDAVFHNGRPFTAQDVVFSWERAADPDTDSDTVMTYLSDIVGVKEMHTGKSKSISGLKVIDDHTLQVTIDAPKPYFLLKLTYPTAYIVDRENVSIGEDWYRTPNGTGPYRLVRWDPMEKMIYQRFEDYFGTKPAIPNVLYTLYTGYGLRLYENGSVDYTGVGMYDGQRVTDPGDPLSKELVTGVSLCTSYMSFDVTQPPFDDVKVRQAFTLAFDRELYNKVILLDSAFPAKGLYPPALPGYNLDLKGLEYDPAKARQLLKDSIYGAPGAMPEIIFTSGGLGSYISGDVGALIQMWQQNLGVSITVHNMEPEVMLDEIHKGYHGQIINGGWCADYPDPENFADVLFHSGAEMNSGNYTNPELDQILEDARVEPDVSKRMELYQQAEKIIVQDAPALFLTHSIAYVLVKPYLKGFILSPVSTFSGIRYMYMDENYWE